MKLSIFLTFVLVFVLNQNTIFANPHDSAPSQNVPAQPDQQNSGQDLQDMDVNVGRPKNPYPGQKFYNQGYYPFRQSMSPRLGISSKKGTDGAAIFTMGVLYMFPEIKSPQTEIGIDVFSNSMGFIHYGIRHIANERTYFRTYYKYGVGIGMDPKDGLASLADIEKSYYGKFAIGLEKFFKSPLSFRLDAELAISLKEAFATVYCGYSWGW